MRSVGDGSPPSRPAWLAAQISQFDSAKCVTPSGMLSIGAFLNGVKSGRWNSIVQSYRDLARLDRNAAKSFKESGIPAAAISGTFSIRRDDALINHSGILCADLDDLNDEIDDVRKKLQACPEIAAIFESVSGTGLKALFRAAADPAAHRENYRLLEALVYKVTGHSPDRACKNVGRLCFVSHDSSVWINPSNPEPIRTVGTTLITVPTVPTVRQTVSSLSSLSGEDALKAAVETAVQECLPKKDRQNHAMLFNLARMVRMIEARREIAFSDNERHAIVERWFSANRFKRHDFSQYWGEFLEAHDSVRFDCQANPTDEAFKTAMANPFPPEAKAFATDEERKLIAIAAQLEKMNSGKPWPLACRKAAALLGTIGHETANVYLRRLVRLGILEIAKEGNTVLAHRYRHITKSPVKNE